MCRHIFTFHYLCGHKSIKHEQCADAISPFPTIFCDLYSIEDRISATSLCCGSLCREDPRMATRPAFARFAEEIADIDALIRKEEAECRIALSRSLTGGPIEQHRENMSYEQHRQSLDELRVKRDELGSQARKLIDTGNRDQTTHLNNVQGKLLEVSSWTSIAHSEAYTGTQILTGTPELPQLGSHTARGIGGNAVDAHAPVALYSQPVEAPMTGHLPEYTTPQSIPSRLFGNPGIFVPNFSHVSRMFPKANALMSSPINHHHGIPPQGGLGMPHTAPRVSRADPVLTAADLQVPGPSSAHGRNSRVLEQGRARRRANSRASEPDAAPSSVRRSGRLSNKQKIQYTELSDDEVEFSPSQIRSSTPRARTKSNPDVVTSSRKTGQVSKDGRAGMTVDYGHAISAASDEDAKSTSDVDTIVPGAGTDPFDDKSRPFIGQGQIGPQRHTIGSLFQPTDPFTSSILESQRRLTEFGALQGGGHQAPGMYYPGGPENTHTHPSVTSQFYHQVPTSDNFSSLQAPAPQAPMVPTQLRTNNTATNPAFQYGTTYGTSNAPIFDLASGEEEEPPGLPFTNSPIPQPAYPNTDNSYCYGDDATGPNMQRETLDAAFAAQSSFRIGSEHQEAVRHLDELTRRHTEMLMARQKSTYQDFVDMSDPSDGG